jgi:glycosyltransferase involved in cell wall biosynthesis
MPDFQPVQAVKAIRAKSRIQPPGIRPVEPRRRPISPPLHILWAARWEFDKGPETFFGALEKLQEAGKPFRLSVIGEQFREAPPVFARARERFADRIDRWGYQPSRTEYQAALSEADIVVSTAEHEFFGISMVEAIAAGAWPVLPRRLAYPEILGLADNPDASEFFYDGSELGLRESLCALIDRAGCSDLWRGRPDRARRFVTRIFWPRRAVELDAALARLAP